MLIMWLIVVAITVPLATYFRPYPLSVLINIFYLFIPLLIVGYITLELNWRKRERGTLIEREEERQAFVAQIFQAQEDERKRIAQELHDDAIQSLLVIGNSVQKIANDANILSGEQLKTQTAAISGEIIRISDDLRRLTLDLRPSILDNIGFLPALRWLVDRLHQDGQIDAKIVIKGEEREIPHKIDVITFRIVQEALNNVLLHSKATETILTLEFSEETVKISIYDNGKGFTLPKRINALASEGKLGLIGIQERIRTLHGTFDIKSRLGEGTAISVEFKV